MSGSTSTSEGFDAQNIPSAQKRAATDAVSVAVHEASHAVAGICLGRTGLLEWVNIIETTDRAGACKWNLENHTAIPGEDFAVGFAGPLGQVLFLPDLFCDEVGKFRITINQPRERLEKWGVGGWLSTDLVPFRTLVPNYPFTQGASGEKLMLRTIEARMRELLNRTTVASAINDLASRLEAECIVEGKAAETSIRRHLAQADFVERTFLLI